MTQKLPPSRKRKRRKTAKKHTQLLAAHRHRYDEMLAAQGGHCALCSAIPSPNRKLDLDHDHHRMVIRGLLCARCNRALGWAEKFGKDSKWFAAAAEYVDRSA